MLGLGVTVSMLAAPTGQLFMGIMLKPISEDLGWSRTLTTAAITIGTVSTGLLAPLAGLLLDRFGARYLTPIATGAVVGCWALLAGMDSLWQLYVGYAISRALAQSFLSGLAPMTTAANWFLHKRGRAMGFVGMAFPLGGSFLVLAGQLIIEQSGWRSVFVIMGVALAAIGIVPPLVLVRRRPEDVGLRPDGAIARAGVPRHDDGRPVEVTGFTMREALRTAPFWLMVSALFTATLATGALSYHMPAYLTDRGLSPTVAATALSAYGLCGAVSAGIWGFLSERISERVLASVTMALAMVVTVLIAQVRVDALAIPLAAGLGLFARGEGTLLNMMAARYFGRAAYGRVSGAMQPFLMTALGFGPLLASLNFDTSGDYQTTFVVCTGLYLAGALLISGARPPRRPIRGVDMRRDGATAPSG